jgi:NAD(P)-dependent dehydrogenase (short-subunit alcohol dehydrogenase family)
LLIIESESTAYLQGTYLAKIYHSAALTPIYSYIETDLTIDLVKMRPKLGEIFNSEPAMKRIGDRTDLKAACVYLLSNASAYMTSGEMLITGGLHAGRVH